MQQWTIQKRLERWLKITLKCANKLGLSSIDPDRYCSRFQEALVYRIFDLPSDYMPSEYYTGRRNSIAGNEEELNVSLEDYVG